MNDIQGKRIHINGIVQGVGFRPFVFGLAERYALPGWVRNTSAGVDIEVDGSAETLAAFVTALTAELPPLAQIDELTWEDTPAGGFTTFEIVHSTAVPDAFQPISPDVSLCEDCRRELFDPADYRFRYPFINCTNCGPRFTIIQDIPYDRPLTTMAPFSMCEACRREYDDPRDRRFHAQPVACPVCGPQVWLEVADGVQFAGSSNQLDGNRELSDVDLKSSDVEQPTTHDLRTTNDDPRPISDNRLPITAPGEKAIQGTRHLLAEGHIVAVKGLGGFHLACDALNEAAVSMLRQRKLRREKPFALMLPDLETIAQHCYLNDGERELLQDRARPIVLLQRRPGSAIAAACAPGQQHLGVMLPYTPLHHLLFADYRPSSAGGHRSSTVDRQSLVDEQARLTTHDLQTTTDDLRLTALVMTSANLSEEPIATGNEEARTRLSGLADAFLMHDRDIHVRCDDSVMRVVRRQLSVSRQSPDEVLRLTNNDSRPTTYVLPLRRSRGYAPFPVQLPWEVPPLLAAGAELKNTFCLTNGRYAFLSHHIGDLENYETLTSFEDGVAHFQGLFRVTPQLLVYDLHPDYLATRYALARAEREGIPAVGVQHHHAHIAACMAENGLTGDRPVISVSFDGTGYGDDGTIWGGEFLIADYAGYERPYHLATIPLPGGDKAVKEPWRLALAWLNQAGLHWADDLPPTAYGLQHADYGKSALDILKHQLTTGINAPPTSSMGRLFDAVAALAGVRQTINYEAQAAMELEALVDPHETGIYPFTIHHSQSTIDPTPLFHALVTDLHTHTPISTIAARFHNGVANMVRAVCRLLRDDYGLSEVALSGGVWQNVTLLLQATALLQQDDFTVYVHKKVPPNDGGLALGQAMIAATIHQSNKK